MTHAIRAVLLLTFGLAAAAPAQAITFATGQGTDSAGCGAVASPCRTLQQAVTNTPAGGYVVLQGPVDFGPVPIIDKSLSIIGEGGATIRANNVGDGPLPITIGGPGDVSKIVVRLHGLTIEGAGIGRTGVTFIGGARLEIADCVIRNFSDEGVFAQPYLPLYSTYRSFVSVVDTVIENAATGIWIRPVPIGVSAYIDGLNAQNNLFGVGLTYVGTATARAVVINSAATNNSSSGFVAVLRSEPTPAPRGAGLFVVKSSASGNAAGVSSGTLSNSVESDGALSLSRSVVTGNASANGGSKLAHSYGGNVIRGNADDTLGRFSSQPLH